MTFWKPAAAESVETESTVVDKRRPFPSAQYDQLRLVTRWLGARQFPAGFSIRQLLDASVTTSTKREWTIVGRILRGLGYVRHQIRIGKKREWRYFRPKVANDVVTDVGDGNAA